MPLCLLAAEKILGKKSDHILAESRKKAYKSAKQAQKSAARRARIIAECLGLHTSYHAADKQAGKCSNCSDCADFVKTLMARGLEIRLRRRFIKKGCDYYLEGSIKKGSKTAIGDHKSEIKNKTRAFAKCFEKAVKKGCANLPNIAL